jgi:hypothetical protein
MSKASFQFLRRLCTGLLLAVAASTTAFAQFTVPAGATFDVPPGGNLGLACVPLNVQGTLNVNSGQISNAGNTSITAGGTLNGGSGTLTVAGDWSNSGSFNAGTGSVVFLDSCLGTPAVLTGNTVFRNLTLSSATGRSIVLPAGANITVTGTLTIQGAPGLPVQLVSSSGAPATINLAPGATVVNNFSLVAGNVFIGAPPAAVVASIPTLDQFGLALLALLMLAATRKRLIRLSARPAQGQAREPIKNR